MDMNQQVVVEVAVTNPEAIDEESLDTADVYRDATANCMVDIGTNTTAGSTVGYETVNGPGLVTITYAAGSTFSIFVMNDRTPQLTLQGTFQNVASALQRIRVSCSDQENLVGKYVRVGIVPTEAPETVDGATTNGGLYYVFSTQNYYRYTKDTTTEISTSYTRIEELWNYAKNSARAISVDGTNIDVATENRRKGWVATLTSRDEITLTNAIGVQANRPMIGLTDVGNDAEWLGYIINQENGKSWAWDTDAWGTAPSGTENCTTLEGDYRWIGPDSWCIRAPAINDLNVTERAKTRYWLRNESTGQWSNVSEETGSFTIDMDSDDVDPASSDFNGHGVWHAWHRNNATNASLTDGYITEPNSSGDYIYMGYQGAQWDDAGPNDGVERDSVEVVSSGTTSSASEGRRYLYIEYCSPNQSCAPPNSAVSSTQLKLTQTITFSGWSASSSSEVNSLTRGTSTSGLTVTHSSQSATVCGVSSDPSSGNIEVTLFNPGTCTIRASQTGNENYLAATAVDQSFTSTFSSSSNRAPTVAPVDPRVSSVLLPQLSISGATNVLACLDESDSSGNILNSPVLNFDISTKGSSETSGSGSAAISGDRTTAVRVRHTRANVIDTLNSSSGISVYLSSGTFSTSKYLRLRVVPIATSTSTSGSCDDAVSSASSTIEIRPYGLTNTLRKGTIQLK
jgi:hypothetical protein